MSGVGWTVVHILELLSVGKCGKKAAFELQADSDLIPAVSGGWESVRDGRIIPGIRAIGILSAGSTRELKSHRGPACGELHV